MKSAAEIVQKWDAKKITKPGFYLGVPLDVYHARNICDAVSVSSSNLRKIMRESPAHYWDESAYNKDAKPEGEVPRYFTIGRAMHHLMMGEKNFARLFAVPPARMPDANGVMKEFSFKLSSAKAWRDRERKQGRELILPDEVPDLYGMAQALSRHSLVQNGAFNGLAECSGFVKDKETGLWLKIRPDVVPTQSGDVVDFKTTTSVLWNDLLRTIFDNGYHMQFALMRMVFRFLDIPFNSATLVFVEKKRPYCVRPIYLEDDWLDKGERQCREALRTFVRCLNSGVWPGPGGERMDGERMPMPKWVADSIESQLRATGENE